MEIQKDSKGIENAEFTDTCNKVTAACTKRLAKYSKRNVNKNSSEENEKETWLGNAWFASIETTVKIHEYGHFNILVKSSHALYPKQ